MKRRIGSRCGGLQTEGLKEKQLWTRTRSRAHILPHMEKYINTDADAFHSRRRERICYDLALEDETKIETAERVAAGRTVRTKPRTNGDTFLLGMSEFGSVLRTVGHKGTLKQKRHSSYMTFIFLYGSW